ncbi:DMT family transporter [Haloimpatiens sp. FM7315]|uniref:DMT family transporter n=1 Tax=Haloimpatiens sp. FM7315 TaxID=3298609 RepID=UPI0035A2CE23
MKKINGVFYSMFSAAAFGIMPIFAKIAYGFGADAVTVLVFRFLFSALILFPIILIKKIDLKITKKQVRDIIIFGGLSYAATCLNLFLAYNYMSVGLATTLHFIYPIVVTAISWALFKEKLDKCKICALILSAFGIYFLVGGGQSKLSILGVFFALISGVFYSFYIVGAGHSEMRKLNPYVTTFYVSLTASLFIFTGALATNNFSLTIKFKGYLFIIGISIISTVIALMAFLKGIQIIGASNAAVLSTLEPIVSCILGVIILGEELNRAIIFGSILILIAVIIISLSEKKKFKLEDEKNASTLKS